MTLSEEYNALPRSQRWPIEEKILDQIETMVPGWKKVARQEAGSRVDLLTPEGAAVQHTTQYKMIQTGNAFLESKKWKESKDLNEIWTFGIPDALDHLVKIWVVNRTKIEEAIQNQAFGVVGTKLDKNRLGYIITASWLDKNCVVVVP